MPQEGITGLKYYISIETLNVKNVNLRSKRPEDLLYGRLKAIRLIAGIRLTLTHLEVVSSLLTKYHYSTISSLLHL